MSTGDHPKTAAVIAQELGLTTDRKAATGAELQPMSDESLAATVGTVSVYARVAPEHKLLLGLVAGGGTAGVVHAIKAKVRLASSFTTAGLGNPFLSFAELESESLRRAGESLHRESWAENKPTGWYVKTDQLVCSSRDTSEDQCSVVIVSWCGATGSVEQSGFVDPDPIDVGGRRVRAWFSPGHGEALATRIAHRIKRSQPPTR